MSWYILAVIPVFGLLVLVHEFGHFITAKWAGIRVEEFGLGFPPAIVGIRKRDQGGWEVMWLGRSREIDTASIQNPFNETTGGASKAAAPSHTIYSLNLLPIGGFVRMPGESGDMYSGDGQYDEGSFAAKTAGKRIIVLCAGVFMNLLLAFVLFTIAYSQGAPTYPAVIGSIQPNSPAAAAGLQSGDKVLAVNNKPIALFDDMRAAIKNITDHDISHSNTVKITLSIQRQGVSNSIPIPVDARKHPGPNQGALGVTEKVILVSSPAWQAPFKGLQFTYENTKALFVILGQMVTGAIKPQLAGPVGIAQMTGTVAQSVPDMGWFPILTFTGLLSVNLAVVNILPFPALDGGRIVLVLIELLRGGKRLKPEREGLINFIGFAALFLLLIIVTVSDVVHWGS